MGFEYPIVVALVIAATICVTIYVLSIILSSSFNIVSSYSNFIITSYYVSSNFIEISIKNVGNMPIKSVNITIPGVLSLNYTVPDKDYIERGVSLACTCVYGSGWNCRCIPSTATNPSNSIYNCAPIGSSVTSLCRIRIVNNNELTPGTVCKVVVYARFASGLIKTRSLSMVVRS